MKPRVLFIGQNAEGRERLRRIATDSRDTWEKIFVSSEAQALEVLAQGDVQTIVADLPRGGDSLVQTLRKSHPDTARVFLAETTNDRSRPVVSEQFVQTNTDSMTVRSILVRTVDLTSILSDERVLKAVGSIEGLPSVPSTYDALTRVLSDPKSSMADISAIVQQDPAMTLKVLQLVNSAFFGLNKKISSISQAINVLGLDLLKGITLTAHVFAAATQIHVREFSIDLFQAYSIRAARLCQKFAIGSPSSEDAFTVGLLHDIGKLVLAIQHPKELGEVLRRSVETGQDLLSLERELIGANHAEVGAVLLARWGIPLSVVEAVAYHHQPEIAPEPYELLALVHAADALMGIVLCGDPEETLNLEFLDRANTISKIPAWRRQVEALRSHA